MSDLISRQDAIDALAKNMPSLTTPDGCGKFDHDIQVTDEAYVDCMQIIHELPSAQPEQRWIPVSERLPKESSRYFVTRGLKDCNNLWNRVYIVNYSDLMGLCKEKVWWSGNVGKSDFETYDDVLAWMPLPKPYNAETK